LGQSLRSDGLRGQQEMVSSAAGIVSSDLQPSFRADANGPALSRRPVGIIPRCAIAHRGNDEGGNPMPAGQLTRFQVWPPQNIPPKAQP
jgi:hypothetical protein